MDLKSLNKKKFALTVFAGFVFVFLYEWLVHGVCMMGMYEETSYLWRSEDQMENFMPFMMAMQFFFVLVLAFIFTRNYEEKGLGEGLRFGTYMGVLFGLAMFSFYAFMPIPLVLALGWFVGSFIEILALGAIFAFVYRK